MRSLWLPTVAVVPAQLSPLLVLQQLEPHLPLLREQQAMERSRQPTLLTGSQPLDVVCVSSGTAPFGWAAIVDF